MKKKKNNKEKKMYLRCIKCGSTSQNVRYHNGQVNCPYDNFNQSSKEHLHYYCLTCGYDWIKDCLDKK